jgi:hypothetical protein
MSVWRNLLGALLPWFFRTGEAAATAAVNKQDVAVAAENAAAGAASDPAVAKAAADAVAKVEDQVVKKVKGK